MLNVAVAFVVFNRPDETARSFEAIRRAQPRRLYVISDGPRAGRPHEAAQVRASRAIAENVDWDCELVRIHAERNHGCGKRISSGISEALAEVDRLIVIEDDCIAEPSFFSYCVELLDRYADDERVMAISGNNFQQGQRRGGGSYYFSKYPHCWGWATWRRAWQHFDLHLADWPATRETSLLADTGALADEQAYWTKIFNRVHAGRIDSWAFPWTYACFRRGGLTALPNVNLVSNIGFGPTATHTAATHRRRRNQLAGIPTEPLGPMVHPNRVAADHEADRYTYEWVYDGKAKRRRWDVTRWLWRRPPRQAA